MPGGYVGSGEFFACGLDRWSVKQKKWILLRPAKLSSFGQNPNLKSVQIKPGESIQVCEMMLPSQAGTLGDCVRFRLQMRWRNSDSVALFSTPFLIDTRPEIQSTSCGPELLPDSFPGSEGVARSCHGHVGSRVGACRSAEAAVSRYPEPPQAAAKAVWAASGGHLRQPWRTRPKNYLNRPFHGVLSFERQGPILRRPPPRTFHPQVNGKYGMKTPKSTH